MEKPSYRFERKFRVPERTRQEIQAVLRLHPALFSPIYQPRHIHNIYLDTFALDNYEDNMAGIGQRCKVRIRWYGSLFGEISSPTLELKLKANLVGTKDSYPLQPFTFTRGFDVAAVQDVFRDSDLPAGLREDLSCLQAALVNSYYRSYFLSADKRFRVTVDSDMEYLGIRPSSNRFLHRIRDRENIVVELKYQESDDRLARGVASRFPFRLSKNSKYATGLQLLYA